MSKEECPKCDELMFVFMRSIPGTNKVGDIDLYECRACGYEEGLIVFYAEWGFTNEAKARIEKALNIAIEKYEPGMINKKKASGEYPCCDVMHEFDTSLENISP